MSFSPQNKYESLTTYLCLQGGCRTDELDHGNLTVPVHTALVPTRPGRGASLGVFWLLNAWPWCWRILTSSQRRRPSPPSNDSYLTSTSMKMSHVFVLDRLLSDELHKKNGRVLGKCLSIRLCGLIEIALTARTSPPSFGVCSRSMASILVVARQPTAGEPAAPVVTSSSLTPTPRTSMLRLRCSGSYPSISRSDPESSMPTVNAHPNLLTVTRSSY